LYSRHNSIVNMTVKKTTAKKKTTARKPAVRRTSGKEVPLPPARPIRSVTEEATTLKVTREKRLALWAGVLFFMAIIVSVWVVTFKKNVQSHVPVASDSAVEVSALLDNLNQTFREVRSGLRDLQDVVGVEDLGSTPPPTDSEAIAVLQERLAEIEQRVELERFLSRFNTELQQQAQAVNN